MGRRKIIHPKLQPGILYPIDQRLTSFVIFSQIVSRQKSKNQQHAVNIQVTKHGLTTLLVSAQLKMFGKEYVRVIASNSAQEAKIGYITLDGFKAIIKGKPKWLSLLIL